MEYKYVIRKGDWVMAWKPGHNYVLRVPAHGGPAVVQVEDTWESQVKVGNMSCFYLFSVLCKPFCIPGDGAGGRYLGHAGQGEDIGIRRLFFCSCFLYTGHGAGRGHLGRQVKESDWAGFFCLSLPLQILTASEAAQVKVGNLQFLLCFLF